MLQVKRGRNAGDNPGPVVVILLGPPGCGKGTQSRELSRSLGLIHISSGDLLRKVAREDSDLGHTVRTTMNAGQLVSDNLVCQMVLARTAQADCQRGVILDGFPRTMDQARFLCPLLPPRQTIVLDLKMSPTVLVERILGRLTCPACGEIYHIHSRPPRRTGTCDRDSALLGRRGDDSEATVRQRLIDYERQIHPLADHFRELNILQEINADVPPAVLSAQLCTLVRTAIGFNDKKLSVSSFAQPRETKRSGQ
jgi:adenylate kinase